MDANLLQLLQDNQNTVYGKQYHFSEIKDEESYRRMVPLSGYEHFKPYIEQMRKGKENVLTAYPVMSYCHTSGSEGFAKDIPVTIEALKRYSNTLELHKNEILDKFGGKRLWINTFRTDLSKGMEDSLLLSEIYYRFLYEQGALDMEQYVGDKTLMFQKHTEDMFFAKGWAALLAEDIVLFESIFLYDQLWFFHYLEEHFERILDAMEKRVIPAEINLPESVCTNLLSMNIDVTRIAFVKEQCKKGFDKIVCRLWPKLKLISGISNRAFFAENAALQKYIGDTPVHYFCYCASECYIATAKVDNDFLYCLHPKSAFFEFIPFVEDEEKALSQEVDNVQTLLFHELQIGEKYEIVVSNFSGLYRYRMGDVIIVRDFEDGYPVFEVLFRKNLALNIAGEKMGIRQIERVMADLPEISPYIVQYCFAEAIDTIPGKYVTYLTVRQGEILLSEEELADRIDARLRQENAEYDDLRGMNAIEKVCVRILDTEQFALFSKKKGLRDGHGKPKHILPEGFSVEKEWMGETT